LRVLLVAPGLNPVTYKGLGRYCQELFEGLQRHADVDAELIVKSAEEDKVVSTHTEIPFRILIMGQHDIVHALSPEMGIYTPLLSTKSVTTFHDLIPIVAFREMDFRLPFLTAAYTRLTWQLAARARRIIANSTQTARELEEVLGVNRGKIRVVPLGVAETFKPMTRSARNRPPTVGFFGNYTYRKRVNLALDAFKLAQKHLDARLVLAGGKIRTVYQRHFNMPELVKGVAGVETLDHVPESELASLYNSFDVMLFPSSYEGFGLPILEAQKCGVPVLILSDAKIPQEVTKKCVICRDANDMAAKTLALLENPSTRRRVSQAGIDYASQFTWENTVRQTLEVYESITNDLETS
jgi:glycosyltransferase involved in cell wall biosynthesis